MKDTQLVCRGQVWWVDEDYHESIVNMKNYKNNIQAKSRPWLIVSCEENNINAPIVNCLPISSLEPDHLPMHVSFRYKGKSQTVLCEQIKTLNICQLRDYSYTFTSEMLQKVDTALANQLGLSLRLPSYDSIIKLVEKIAEYKAQEMRNEYQDATDEAINALAERLDEIFKVPVVNTRLSDAAAKKLASEVTTPPAKINLSAVQEMRISHSPSAPVVDMTTGELKTDDVSDESKKDPETSEESKADPKKKRAYNSRKWGPSRIQSFLKDCETMGPGDVAKKYGLKDKKAVYSYKYYFKNDPRSK